MASSSSSSTEAVDMVCARQGRQRQRYEGCYRLVSGCIPYMLKDDGDGESSSCVLKERHALDRLQVIMISTPKRSDLIFPKGGWEDDESVEEAASREAFEEAGVKGIINDLYNNVTVYGSNYSWIGFRLPVYNSLACALRWPTGPYYHANMINIENILADGFHEGAPMGEWIFKSKSKQNSCGLEGACKGFMFGLQVTELLESWPEQVTHGRRWVPVEEAYGLCRYDWMREALDKLKEKLLFGSNFSAPPSPELLDSASLYMVMPAAVAEGAAALC